MFRRLAKFVFTVTLVMGTAGLVARLLLTGRGGPDSDEVDLVTVFEGLHLRSHSSSFMGGSTLALFGGIVLDLRRAQLGPTGADLTVLTLFGGTGIVVPPDWRVEVDARTWLGGLDLSNDPPEDEGGPILRIRARTLFGGLQVESRPRLEAVS
ncbi:MAG TPA: LiaF domain-containing protein [Acidimicrobiia bacterium]|nr:LiaF domain-containing protein [Acidimicrobiia bacterium]